MNDLPNLPHILSYYIEKKRRKTMGRKRRKEMKEEEEEEEEGENSNEPPLITMASDSWVHRDSHCGDPSSLQWQPSSAADSLEPRNTLALKAGAELNITFWCLGQWDYITGTLPRERTLRWTPGDDPRKQVYTACTRPTQKVPDYLEWKNACQASSVGLIPSSDSPGQM